MQYTEVAFKESDRPNVSNEYEDKMEGQYLGSLEGLSIHWIKEC